MVTPMAPWFHVRHVLLMPATCDCAWLLKMPIVATMRGHMSLALLDRSHHDPLEPCALGEFRVFESVGCFQLLLFCRHCCNSDGRFATLFDFCGYDCCDRLRSTLGRCGWRLPPWVLAGVVQWVPHPSLVISSAMLVRWALKSGSVIVFSMMQQTLLSAQCRPAACSLAGQSAPALAAVSSSLLVVIWWQWVRSMHNMNSFVVWWYPV